MELVKKDATHAIFLFNGMAATALAVVDSCEQSLEALLTGNS